MYTRCAVLLTVYPCQSPAALNHHVGKCSRNGALPLGRKGSTSLRDSISARSLYRDKYGHPGSLRAFSRSAITPVPGCFLTAAHRKTDVSVLSPFSEIPIHGNTVLIWLSLVHSPTRASVNTHCGTVLTQKGQALPARGKGQAAPYYLLLRTMDEPCSWETLPKNPLGQPG